MIAFANADFEQCEQALSGLTGLGGNRSQHAETWLVLFDLYRATGQQHKFESLALDYAQQFGWSAPQWFSMPKLVAEAASEERPSSSRIDGQVGWVCPNYLDADGVARLASLALQMPLPWVFDWGALQYDRRRGRRAGSPSSSAAGSPQDLDMRWLSGERLFTVLQEAAPTGVRDADPAYWQLRLDALRMTNRPDQFDEAAIDYCVTYEVSPPSWEAARCVVRVTGSNQGTTQPPLSVVSDVSTSFQESQLTDAPQMVEVGTVELSGQLIGDISHTLRKMDSELGTAKIVNVSCATPDPGRFHRRRRPAELGAGAAQPRTARSASSTRTGWWRCSSARWASTSTPTSRCARSDPPAAAGPPLRLEFPAAGHNLAPDGLLSRHDDRQRAPRRHVALGGDGQVTLGNIVVKATARKIRRLHHDKVLAGFAGATADAFTLFERFEAKLEKHQGHLVRSAIELTKDWRTDRVLRRLEAMLAVADRESSLIITGNGDVLEPEYGIIAIGSGGSYAQRRRARPAAAHRDGAQGHRQALARDRRRPVHLHQPEPHHRDAGLMEPSNPA